MSYFVLTTVMIGPSQVALVKNPSVNAIRRRILRFIPKLGQCPGGVHGKLPSILSLTAESLEQRRLAGYGSGGHKGSDMNKSCTPHTVIIKFKKLFDIMNLKLSPVITISVEYQ